eukprot:7273921-Pyramimonas_sp.AAC.1
MCRSKAQQSWARDPPAPHATRPRDPQGELAIRPRGGRPTGRVANHGPRHVRGPNGGGQGTHT